MAKKKVNVGMVGGAFMGKAHSAGYRSVAAAFPKVKAEPVMLEIAAATQAEADEACARLGWQRASEGWQEIVSRPDIHLIDICTGNKTHADIAIAAAESGKHVFCEKPMAMSVDQCFKMIVALERAGTIGMIDFNYRRAPAIELAKIMIERGMIGTPYHFRAVYLQDWIVDPEFPLVWRLLKDEAGSGSHGDLNAHIIDMARNLVGEFDEVNGMMTTFIKKRPMPGTETSGLSKADGIAEMGDVTVDDATIFMAKFKNGITIGTFEATRFAPGEKNALRLELNGSEGGIRFNLERLNELEFFSRKDKPGFQGWRTILATEPVHPFLKGWWPAGHIVGWDATFVHQVYTLMNGIATSKQPTPSFYDGLKCQQVLEAVEQSAETGQWMKVAT